MVRRSRMMGLIGMAVTALCAGRIAQGQPHKESKVPLDLYVMSYCPFGVKAEEIIVPAVKSLAPHVELNLHFIASEQPSPEGQAGPKHFASLHGEAEVAENLRQICAKRHFPNTYLDFILERNKNIQDPNWQGAATATGLDPEVIRGCAEGSEGASLLSEDLKAAQVRRATGSPTIDINGAPYMGARGLRSVTLALCDVLKARGIPTPEACAKAEAMPPDPVPSAGGCGGVARPGGAPTPSSIAPSQLAFNLQVVVDPACPMDQLAPLEWLRHLYPAARVTSIEADSRRGRRLLARVKPHRLPLYLLDAAVEQTETFPQLKGNYLKGPDYYLLKPRRGVPDVDLDRQRLPHHVDLFLSSLSPLSTQGALELLRVLQETRPRHLTLSLHFIVQEAVRDSAPAGGAPASPQPGRSAPVAELDALSPGPLISRGGAEELNESLRQRCLFQHASLGAFFTYLYCRSQDLTAAARAETCLVPGEALTQCMEGPEGEQLLRADARLARDLGITDGPVLVWENRCGPLSWYDSTTLQQRMIETSR